MSCNPVYPEESVQILGVVLCGGKSSRMGSDKGLLVKDNLTWAEIAAEKIEALYFPCCFSVSEKQFENYSGLFGAERLVKDNIQGSGPLKGLLSVHNRYPFHDLFILACDMPDIPVSLMEKLYAEFKNREGEHDFFVYSNEGNVEPLTGIYTREGLQKLTDLLTLGLLEKHSMKHVLEIGNTFLIEMTETEKKFFSNYNAPEDLMAAGQPNL